MKTHTICGMTVFKEVDNKLVKVADFQHGMDTEMNTLIHATELLEALEGLTRWVGKGIADDMYNDCVNPERAQVDLTRAEDAIKKARGK